MKWMIQLILLGVLSYACKMCIKSLTGADVMKHFSLSLSHRTNKLERLSLML
jgi:hypothetical protein